MSALELICAEAHEGERYRDRVNTFYNRLYKRANNIVGKAQPCGTTRDAEGRVVCAGCAHRNSVSPDTLCCKDCEHHGPEGCKASMPLACRTWLCPAAAEKNPEAAHKLNRLAYRADRVGVYQARASKAQTMAKRFQAEALVSAILDAEAVKPLKVRVYWHEQFMEVPAVMTLSPQKWTAYIAGGAHGLDQFRLRVDGPDQPDFIFALRDLLTKPVPVPAKWHWALKMPGGYAILGEGDVGVSCTQKREIISWDQQLVDNPNMSEFQARRWGTARKAL